MTSSDIHRTPKSYRVPNLAIGLRVALAFVAIGLFSLPFPFSVAALVLTLVVISLDALDGILAHRLGVTTRSMRRSAPLHPALNQLTPFRNSSNDLEEGPTLGESRSPSGGGGGAAGR